MKNKKYIFMLLIFVFVLFVNGCSQKINIITESPKMKYSFKFIDVYSSEEFSANYDGQCYGAWDKNNNIQNFNSITEKGVWTTLEIYQNSSCFFNVWDKNHYTNTIGLAEGATLVEKNSAKYEIMHIGDLKVSTDGELKEGKNIVYLNITSLNGRFYKTGMCTKASANVISVESLANARICDIGWKEYSSNIYYCGYIQAAEVLKCSSLINDNKTCVLSKINIPQRFYDNNFPNVDHCYGFETTIERDSTLTVPIEVYALNLNDKDYVEIYILDKDKKLINGVWDYAYEDVDGEDVGAPDYLTTLRKL